MCIDYVALLKELEEWRSAGTYKHCAPNGAQNPSSVTRGLNHSMKSKTYFSSNAISNLRKNFMYSVLNDCFW